MRLGILVAGRLDKPLRDGFGAYPAMFHACLGQADPALSFASWHIVDGAFPENPKVCDAWLVTGSRHGVYDPLPWIAPACEFLREAYGADVPVIGVCFGHQILAQALGGKVEKSARGWGLGLSRYEMTECVPERAPWMAGAGATLDLLSIHQDQVVVCPPGATVLARSEFCPYAVLSYGDRAFSVQPHPEFTPTFLAALLESCRGRIPDPNIDAAIESLDGPNNDSACFAAWMASFATRRYRQRQAAA